MNALTFLRTLTPEEYYLEANTSRLDVKENPKDKGKFFFCNAAGVVLGAVSSKMVTEGVQTPVISEVQGAEGKFFLMHNKGEGGAATIFSLSK